MALGSLSQQVFQPPALLAPNFEGTSPVASALSQDDVVLAFTLAEFLDLNKEAFDKIELGRWAVQAACGGKVACLHVLLYYMRKQQKMDVKMIQPFVTQAL